MGLLCYSSASLLSSRTTALPGLCDHRNEGSLCHLGGFCEFPAGAWYLEFLPRPSPARLRSKAFCPEDEGLLRLLSLYSKADSEWVGSSLLSLSPRQPIGLSGLYFPVVLAGWHRGLVPFGVGEVPGTQRRMTFLLPDGQLSGYPCCICSRQSQCCVSWDPVITSHFGFVLSPQPCSQLGWALFSLQLVLLFFTGCSHSSRNQECNSASCLGQACRNCSWHLPHSCSPPPRLCSHFPPCLWSQSSSPILSPDLKLLALSPMSLQTALSFPGKSSTMFSIARESFENFPG